MLAENGFPKSTEKIDTKMLSLLIETGSKLGREITCEGVIDTIVSEARRIFNAKAAWLFLYDPHDDLLKMRHYWGPGEEMFEGLSIRPGIGVCGKVFLTQRLEIIAEASKHPASIFYNRVLSPDISTVVVCPVTSGERNIGVLGISSGELMGIRYEGDDVLPIQAFSQQAAISLSRAMLFEENKRSESNLQSSIKTLQMLNEIGIDLANPLDLSVIIRKVARYTAEILDADAAIINLGNRDGTAVEKSCIYNMPSGTEKILFTKGTIANAVFKNPQRVLINDYHRYPKAITEFIEIGLCCLILVPVISRGRVLATLSAISLSPEKTFSEADFDKLELIARHVAISIENAMLYNTQIEASERMETYAGQLRSLNEHSQIITREKEPRKMVCLLASSARMLLNCASTAAIVFMESGSRDTLFSWSSDEGEMCLADCRYIENMVHECFHNGLAGTKIPIRLDGKINCSGSMNIAHHPLLNGLLSAPLIGTDDILIGYVIATGKNDEQSFSETDEELLVALCAQAAIGIEKAEAYEREHSIAETLQQAILTIPVGLPGIEVGVTYESAAEATRVGGDFYDLFELGDGRISLLIGDVSGKGLEAATITSMVKSTIRAFAYRGLSPAYVLTEANRAICEQLKADQFVTMVYSVLDPIASTLTIARAGHPEIIIWRGSMCIQTETCSNLPLGIVAELVYEEGVIDVAADDVVILYTDGLTEAKRNDMLLGEDRVIAGLNQIIQGKRPQQITREMVGIAKEFAGGKLQDDVAVVALSLSPYLSNQTH